MIFLQMVLATTIGAVAGFILIVGVVFIFFKISDLFEKKKPIKPELATLIGLEITGINITMDYEGDGYFTTINLSNGKTLNISINEYYLS